MNSNGSSLDKLDVKERHQLETVSRTMFGFLFVDLTGKQSFIKGFLIGACVAFLLNMHSLFVIAVLLSLNLIRTIRYIYNLQGETMSYPEIFKLDATATISIVLLVISVLACWSALIVPLVK